MFLTKRDVKDVIETILLDLHQKEKAVLKEFTSFKQLKEKIEDLKISKARLQEENAKDIREVEHKVGLERKRQEFEIEQAKRETQVTLREENLKADRERFDDQIKFHEKRFTEEVAYLKDMVSQVLKRLPSAEILAQFGGKSGSSDLVSGRSD